MGARRGGGGRQGSRVSAPPEMPICVLQMIAGLDPTLGGPSVTAIQTSLAFRELAIWEDYLASGRNWLRPWALYALVRWVESLESAAP